MRILVVGAGATGGYFGARLAQAGRDVTFLLRGARAADVRANGLRLAGQGAEQVVPVSVVTAAEISGPYDLILFAVRNSALDTAADDIAGAVGPGTLIVPFLNGMSHMDRLNERFGEHAVLGGVVLAARELGEQGEIIRHARGQAHDRGMWSKWVFISTLAALTCLMRGTVGEIASTPGGEELAPAFLAEAAATAAACGHPLPEGDVGSDTATFTQKDSKLTASLYRDAVAGRPTESPYILDDLVRRARDRDVETPLLELAALQLRIYNARTTQARTAQGV